MRKVVQPEDYYDQMLFLIPFIGYKETIGSYTSNETQDLQEPTPEEINQNYDSKNINEEQSSNVPNAQFLTGSMTGIQETGRRNEDEVNLPSTSKQPLNLSKLLVTRKMLMNNLC